MSNEFSSVEHLEDVEKYNKIHPDVIPPACGLPEQTGGRKVEPGIQNAIVPTYLPTYRWAVEWIPAIHSTGVEPCGNDEAAGVTPMCVGHSLPRLRGRIRVGVE